MTAHFSSERGRGCFSWSNCLKQMGGNGMMRRTQVIYSVILNLKTLLRAPRDKRLHYDGGHFYFIYRERRHGWAFLEAAGAKETRERDDAKKREWYVAKHQYICYLSLPATTAGQKVRLYINTAILFVCLCVRIKEDVTSVLYKKLYVTFIYISEKKFSSFNWNDN